MLLHHVIEFAAASRPRDPAIIDGAGLHTFANLHERAGSIADWARAVAPPGGRIAMLAAPSVDVVAALYGVPAAGRIIVPVNLRLHPDDITALLGDVDAAAVLGDPDVLDRSLGHHSREHADLREVATGATTSTGIGDSVDEGDTAWIIHTSGTTGPAKGACITHRSLLAAVHNTAVARPLADDDVVLFPFPLFHVAAYNVVHAHFRRRPVVLPNRFDVAMLADLIADNGVTTMSVAPTMLSMLLFAGPDADEARSVDSPTLDRLASLRSLSYGASPMPPDLVETAIDTLGVRMAQGYGMTELSGNAVFLPHEDHLAGLRGDERRLRSAGRPGPMVELRLGDGDELEIRGDQVFAGYWNRPDETAAAFTEDGWLRTGDIASIDADGLVTIVDRAKDIVITGGENVSARDVEECLRVHDGIADVAVIGTPHPTWGEAVTAIVVRSGDVVDADADALDAWFRPRIAGFKRPRRYEFVDELPTTASGKVDKGALRRRFPTSSSDD